jgi:hypothetical protein
MPDPASGRSGREIVGQSIRIEIQWQAQMVREEHGWHLNPLVQPSRLSAWWQFARFQTLRAAITIPGKNSGGIS